MEASNTISSQETKTTTTNQRQTIRQQQRRPQHTNIVLLLENSRKNNNWGPLLRCASAFGIQTVVFVGFAACSVRGSHGADSHVEIIAFPTVAQAVDFLRHDYQHHRHDQDDDDLDINSSNNCNHDNDARTVSPATSTTTTTAKSTTTIIGLLGAVPGGYSSHGCGLRLEEEEDDNNGDDEANDGAEPIDQSSNTAARLVQAVVVDDDDDSSSSSSSSSTMTLPTATSWSSRRSYPVSNAARMKQFLLAYSSSDVTESMMAAGGEQQPETMTKTKTVVLAVSKDLHGLPLSLSQHCDAFCHVPHVAIPGGAAPVPLLDLPTTLSIALHHMTAHLGYREGEFQGHKFQVASKNQAKQPDGGCHHQRKIQEHRAEKQKYREQLADDVAMDHGGLTLWPQGEQEDDY